MPNPARNHTVRRVGLAAAAILLFGCAGPLKLGFPRRPPGSDVALPPSTTEVLVDAALGCANPVDTKSGAGARDVATCRKATGDTIPDTKQPPPPTKTP